MEPQRAAVDAHNRDVEAQNGALGDLQTSGNFDEEQDPDSDPH